MNVLLCCCSGFSTSILVKAMREEAIRIGRQDIKIGSIGVDMLYEYIDRSDVILIAPQLFHEYDHLKKLADDAGKPMYVVNRDDYGSMDGKKVLSNMLFQIERDDREDIKMDTVSTFIESKLMPIAIKVGSNKVLTIIRNAMCATMSLLIIGSISILLTSFPIDAVAKFLQPASPFLNAIYNCTTGMMGLFTAASMAYYAAVEYKADIFSSIITSVSAFLLTQISLDGVLNIGGLGSSGLLTAMVIGFVTVKVIDLFKRKHLVIKMPAGVPEAVSESFSSLIPAVLILVVFGSVSLIFGFNINDILATMMSPLSGAINTPWGYAIYHMLCGLVFFCGINSAVVIGVVQAFIMQNGAMNEAAFKAGETIQYAATYATDTMIWAGGTGATIGLVILMAIRSKSKTMKTMGRMSIGPGIFNINEPVIFGTPICFNPIFLIPFVLLPGILAFSTYMLMDLGVIAMPTVGMVPWTLPPVAIGFVMSNGAISTGVWSIAVVLISIIVYYPFFKMADKREYLNEKKAQQEEAAAQE
ncbi:PTS transporter subunit EIIC [Amedibacillus sp. YH-ame6]